MPANRLLLRAALLICVATMLGEQCGAQDRSPSTAEERAKAVQLARLLETDPLNKDAKEARRWVTLWLIRVPDITVSVCMDFLAPLAGAKDKYASEIFTQMMLSSAAFVIENPGKSKDALAVYTAGLEGAIKTYEAILKAKPKSKWAFLDDLIERRNKAQLVSFVQETIPKCGQKVLVVPK